MIEIKITKEQINEAGKIYEFNNLNGSITKGKSQIYGALGEVVVRDYFETQFSIDFTSTYDYDMIIDGIKVDVKTKRTTVKPKPNYLCSISNFNTKQKCDCYFFLRIKEDLGTAYLLGYMKKKRYFKLANFVKKGDLDINGFVFKDDCHNLEISRLKPFKEIRKDK